MNLLRPIAFSLVLPLVVGCANQGGPSGSSSNPNQTPSPADAATPHPAPHDGGAPVADAAEPAHADASQPQEPPDASQPPPQHQPDASQPPPQQPAHRRCGWAFTNEQYEVADFVQNAAWFDAIHPVWFAMNQDGVSIRTIAGVDDAQVLAAAKANHVQVWPLVASVENAAFTRAMLYDPANRAAHIKNLVDTAVTRGYVGLDLDYEHLWNAADHAPLMAFVAEFATAMHAAGKKASFAVPPLDGASPVWDYTVLATNLDESHIMGYDLHTVGTHAGPTAPLGWIDQVAAQAAATGHPEKFIMGLPNYGITSSSFCSLGSCAATCSGPIASSTDHMQTCSFGNWNAGRILNCNSGNGMLYFDDTASLEEKVQSSKQHGLGGITYWNLGDEPAGFFEMIKKYY